MDHHPDQDNQDANDADLRRRNQELERLVRERSEELLCTIGDLQESIAHHRHTEQRLREELATNRALVDSAQSIILWLDVDGNIVRFNKFMEELSGYTLAEVEGKNWFTTFLPPDQIEEVNRMFKSALQGKQTRGFINPIVTKAGELRQIKWFDIPLKDTDGGLKGLLSTGYDVTERLERDAKLRESEERIRAILNTAGDAIVTIDNHGIIESVNHATESIFGYTADELVGQNINLLMPSPDHERHDAYIERYLRTGEARIIGKGREVTALRKDGSEFPADLAITEVDDLGLFTGIIRDISERVENEEKLRHADRLASIGTLAAGLGHDMNNILLPVRARLDIIDQVDIEPNVREHFAEIRKSMRYLQDLSDGLLQLTLDPDSEDRSTDDTDINVWWAQSEGLLLRAISSDARFKDSIEPNLPAINVPPHRLTQAVLNLLINSSKAVGDDGHISFWVKPGPKNTVRIGVTDNGSGMTDEIRRHALEPFFTTKTRGLGTGMGLSLVQGVAKAAGGIIEIESAPGKGTTVTMTFPAAHKKTSEDQSTNTEKTPAIVTLQDQRIGSLVASILKASGYDTDDTATEPTRATGVWVTDATDQTQGFLKSNPWAAPRTVLLGPCNHGWDHLPCRYVPDPSKYAELRAAIELAAGS